MPRSLFRPLWMIAQASAIGGLMWMSFFGDDIARQTPRGPVEILVALAIWTLLVAFATAVIVNLWDWAARKAKGLRRPGLSPMRREGDDAVEQRDSRGARLGVGELRQPPTTLRGRE